MPPAPAPDFTPDEMAEHLVEYAHALTDLAGWDQPPVLAIAQMRPAFTVIPLVPTVDVWHGVTPFSVVRAYARGFARKTPAVDRAMAMLAVPEFVGVCLAVESYVFFGTPQERAAIAASGRSLADHPGARESRHIVFVDTVGRSYLVQAMRGGEVTAHWVAPDGQHGGHDGPVGPWGLLDGRMFEEVRDLANNFNRELGRQPIPREAPMAAAVGESLADELQQHLAAANGTAAVAGEGSKGASGAGDVEVSFE